MNSILGIIFALAVGIYFAISQLRRYYLVRKIKIISSRENNTRFRIVDIYSCTGLPLRTYFFKTGDKNNDVKKLKSLINVLRNKGFNFKKELQEIGIPDKILPELKNIYLYSEKPLWRGKIFKIMDKNCTA